MFDENKEDQPLFSFGDPLPPMSDEESEETGLFGGFGDTDQSIYENVLDKKEEKAFDFKSSMAGIFDSLKDSEGLEENQEDTESSQPIKQEEVFPETIEKPQKEKIEDKQIEKEAITQNNIEVENKDFTEAVNNLKEEEKHEEVVSISDVMPVESSKVFEENETFDNNEAKPLAEEDEKARERQYWAFMDELVDHFDDGRVHTEFEKNNLTSEAEVLSANPQDEQTPEAILENFGKAVNSSSSAVRQKPGIFAASVFSKTQPIKENLKPEEKITDESDFKEEPVKEAVEKEKIKKAKKLFKEKASRVKSVPVTKSEKSTKTKKPKTAKDIVRIVVIIISVVVLLGCVSYLGDRLIKNYINSKGNDDLLKMLNSSDQSNLTWSEIYAKYPNISFPPMMQIKFAELYAQNQSMVGWIKLKNLGIDLPVVQTTNDTFYLTHDFFKKPSIYGTPFLSCVNNFPSGKSLEEIEKYVSDLNTVIYAHAMKSGNQMFSNLKTYKTVDGFVNNPVIEYDTLYRHYKYKVFAVFITNGGLEGDLNGYVFNYFFTNLSSYQKVAEYIDQIKQRQLYDTGVDVKPTDKFITLSTCTYEFDNARLVVVGRLVRDGESENVDTSKAKINVNPRYPQAWYTKDGKKNPFSGYAQWDPNRQ